MQTDSFQYSVENYIARVKFARPDKLNSLTFKVYRDLTDLFDESYWYGHAGLMYSAQQLAVHLTYTYVDETARHLFGHERASIAWSGTLIWRFGGAD